MMKLVEGKFRPIRGNGKVCTWGTFLIWKASWHLFGKINSIFGHSQIMQVVRWPCGHTSGTQPWAVCHCLIWTPRGKKFCWFLVLYFMFEFKVIHLPTMCNAQAKTGVYVLQFFLLINCQNCIYVVFFRLIYSYIVDINFN